MSAELRVVAVAVIVVTLTSSSLCSSFLPFDDQIVYNLQPPSNYTLEFKSGSGRIVGGVEAIPNEFPWQAYLEIEVDRGFYLCGGSLIADQWILTAAHCLVHPYDPVRSVTVALGAHNLANTSEYSLEIYIGQSFVQHPTWNPNTFAGDIALIKLTTRVSYSQYIRPINLADSKEPNHVNDLVTVAGWGLKSDSSLYGSPTLQKVTVPVISNSDCKLIYGNVIINEMICTSGANYRGTCNGDSGGPLNYKGSDGSWKQIGIVSFGSAGGCQMNRPNGYTRISSYSSWIQNVASLPPPTTTTLPSTKTTTLPSSGGQSTISAFLPSSLVSILLLLTCLGL